MERNSPEYNAVVAKHGQEAANIILDRIKVANNRVRSAQTLKDRADNNVAKAEAAARGMAAGGGGPSDELMNYLAESRREQYERNRALNAAIRDAEYAAAEPERLDRQQEQDQAQIEADHAGPGPVLRRYLAEQDARAAAGRRRRGENGKVLMAGQYAMNALGTLGRAVTNCVGSRCRRPRGANQVYVGNMAPAIPAPRRGWRSQEPNYKSGWEIGQRKTRKSRKTRRNNRKSRANRNNRR